MGATASTSAGGTASDPAADVVVDDALHAATAYRNVGQVFVAVLTAIPTATLITGAVKVPDDGTWDTHDLVLGLVLAGIALVAGMAAVVWIRLPAKLTDDDLKDFDMGRVLGARSPTYKDLLDGIDQLLQKAPADRTQTDKDDLAGHLQVRQNVYRLATADALAARVTAFRLWAFVVIAIAASLAATGFLAVAPHKQTPAEPVSVVSVELTQGGVAAFGCGKAKFAAIKIGGTDDEPEVIPIGATCTKGNLLKLKVGHDASAAAADPVKPIEQKSK